MARLFRPLLLACACLLGLGAHAEDRFITVASTTSTEQSGLFGYILPRFEQQSGELRCAFENQHARHDRSPRKMIVKEVFAQGDVLGGFRKRPHFPADDAVDEEKAHGDIGTLPQGPRSGDANLTLKLVPAAGRGRAVRLPPVAMVPGMMVPHPRLTDDRVVDRRRWRQDTRRRHHPRRRCNHDSWIRHHWCNHNRARGHHNRRLNHHRRRTHRRHLNSNRDSEPTTGEGSCSGHAGQQTNHQ